MNYYSALKASKETGVDPAEIARLIKAGEIEATKGIGAKAAYKIPQSELAKLRDLGSKKKKRKVNSTKNDAKGENQADKVEKYCSVQEASEKVATPKTLILRWLREGKIRGEKMGGKGNPYRIPLAELEKLKELAAVPKSTRGKKSAKEEQKQKPQKRQKQEVKSVPVAKADLHSQDLLEIQKNLAEAVNRISITQERLTELLRKS